MEEVTAHQRGAGQTADHQLCLAIAACSHLCEAPIGSNEVSIESAEVSGHFEIKIPRIFTCQELLMLQEAPKIGLFAGYFETILLHSVDVYQHINVSETKYWTDLDCLDSWQSNYTVFVGIL